MLPVSLSLKGIYSYQTEQTIDFSRLTQNRLFGIFGSVGSGKSTILEAITLALYDETERINKKENRKYNLMNLKSNDLMVDFVFLGGRENKKYRFHVKSRRNSKRFEDVKTFERSRYEWCEQKNDWIPIETEAEDILGLTYENFRRTIIIPQGKFQEFLQLGKTDRTKMLEQIFQLEQFDMLNQASALEKENKSALDQLKGQLQGLEAVDGEALNGMIKEQLDLVDKLDQNKQKYDEHQKVLKEVETLAETLKELEQVKKDLAQFKDEKEDIDQREAFLLLYNNCFANFKEDINRVTELEFEKNKLESSCQHLEEEGKVLQTQREILEKKQQAFEAEHTNKASLELLLQDIRLIHKMAKERQQASFSFKVYNEAKQKFKQFCVEVFDQNETVITQKQKAREKILLDQNKRIPDRQTVSRVRSWFQYDDVLKVEQEKLDEKNQEIAVRLKKTGSEKINIYRASGLDRWIEDDWSHLKFGELKASLEREKQKVEQEQNKLQEQKIELNTQLKLESIARHLKDGCACPVCGSTQHPQKLEAGTVERKLRDLEQKKQSLQEKLGCIADTLERLSTLKAQYKERVLTQKELSKEVMACQQKRAEHKKSFQWNGYKLDTEVEWIEIEQKLERYEEKWELVDQYTSELEELRKKQEVLQREKDQLQKELTAVAESKNRSEVAMDTLKGQLEKLSWNDYAQMQMPEIIAIGKSFRSALEAYEKLEIQKQELEEKIKENITRKKELQKLLQQQNKALTERTQQLHSNVEASEFKSLEEIKLILGKRIDAQKEQNSINTFRQRFSNAEQKLEDLSKKVKGKTYDQTVHRDLQIQNLELQKVMDEQKAQLGGLKNEIQKLQQTLKRKKELFKEQERLDTRKENIGTIKKMFHSKGFVDFVSSLKLKNLCETANDRFSRLSYNHLSLELNRDNQFMVRDFMNGGALRSVKTLSGGQTFQASLCLAIALADIVNQHRGEQADFFFLDEGFGALDKDSLQIVFEALQSLRKENKIIGVISHVEDLKDEIDTYLQIQNGDAGSQIARSW